MTLAGWESARTRRSVPFSNAPLDVAGLDSGIDGVYAAYAHTCAVTSTGGVKCWGGNWSGQLGDGTTISSNVPVDVPGLTGVKAIAGGGAHTCALTNDGGVKCWGANERGQLGDGTRTASRTPVDVEGLASGVKAIAAHDTDGNDYDDRGFTCALLDTGVKCWGDGYGLTPEFVPGIGSEAMAIDAGFEYACAVFNTGGIKCWGRENYSATSGDIVSVSGGGHSGDYNTCVVLNDGRAECWGENDRGEVGDGTTEARWSPVDVIGLGGEISMISMGGSFACALLEDGRVQCWGNNRIGQCGDGTQTHGLSPSYVFGLESGVESVTAGWAHTCAVTTDGAAKCWGNNGNGQCGDGNVCTSAETPVDVVGLDSDVSGDGGGIRVFGGPSSAAASSIGATACPRPQDVAGLTSGVRAISPGCALLTTGAVTCWGTDIVGLGSGVQAIDSSNNNPVYWGNTQKACALMDTGTVKCWLLQNDDGDPLALTPPAPVPGLSGEVTAVTVGGSYSDYYEGHACALLTDGGVKCWGANNNGQLGDGTTTASATPVSVTALGGEAIAVAAGSEHTCAVLENGGVQCWGSNGDGQLGDGTREQSSVPVDVSNIADAAVAITAGGAYGSGVGAHTCALIGERRRPVLGQQRSRAIGQWRQHTIGAGGRVGLRRGRQYRAVAHTAIAAVGMLARHFGAVHAVVAGSGDLNGESCVRAVTNAG